MEKIKKSNFWKRNLTLFHIIGSLLGLGLAILYWYKAGQFSDYVLKNNLFLMSFWGILTGYISFDLMSSARKRMKENRE